jgi:TnpA family transposase
LYKIGRAKSKQTAFSGEATLELRLSVISTHLTGLVIAVSRNGTATADTILRRFNSYNVAHPTYKALAEVGKADRNHIPLRLYGLPQNSKRGERWAYKW